MTEANTLTDKTTTMKRAITNDIQLDVEEILLGNKTLTNAEIITIMTRYFRNIRIMKRINLLIIKSKKDLWQIEGFPILFCALLSQQYKRFMLKLDGISQVGAAGAQERKGQIEEWD